MAHESLTQFLELYVYNVRQSGSPSLDAWTFTRGWTSGAASNTGVAAVLDVYQLVGLETMKRGYRAMGPLNPPYGQGIPASVINAFVAEVPDSLKAQVADKLGSGGILIHSASNAGASPAPAMTRRPPAKRRTRAGINRPCGRTGRRPRRHPRCSPSPGSRTDCRWL